MFISRKTQRLYVRRAFQPILESPVTILDADRPIGTHVFTAMERTRATPTCAGASSHWTADAGRRRGPCRGRARGGVRDVEPMPTDPDGAKAALDRIVIPQDALDRIAEMASPDLP